MNGISHENPKQVVQIRRALSHLHSRLVCEYFRDSSAQTATKHTLAEFIARRDDSDLEAITVHLQYVTLPKLADADLLTYDAERDLVSYDASPAVEALFEHVIGQENRSG